MAHKHKYTLPIKIKKIKKRFPVLEVVILMPHYTTKNTHIYYIVVYVCVHATT